MSTYPLVKFAFEVDWGGTKVGFQEVSGLNAEAALIEYRHGA
ncbi:phage tail protein, partial [Chryseobacterium aquaticum]